MASALISSQVLQHTEVMQVPVAFVRQTQFEDAVARVFQALSPQVVNVIPTLGND